MRRAAPAMAVLVALAGGVRAPASAQEGASGREMTKTMVEAIQVCSPQGFIAGCGPIYVDLASFRRWIGPHVADSAAVEDWFGVPVRDMPKAVAYECRPVDNVPGEEACMMLHDGIHLQVDTAGVGADGLLYIQVTHSWARGAGMRGLGVMSHWFLFERVDGRWVARRGGLLRAI